ncbi:Plasmodium exported protein, unknown function [Plasmodium gallinaceum]|uniref:Tryptophan-rich antigen n=1 Tax=Plasmodium gallinaceum TaxID=5849 RepID=A0A1J1GU38_PLAGA|nr:Plasmodium exported protein, unknown function [Plasmodium gallinaceum]CRG94553.1 Plasmodium exported protein, unknown function [Plasmodium gallinaceum]
MNCINLTFSRYFHLSFLILLCLPLECILKSRSEMYSKLYQKSGYSRILSEKLNNEGFIKDSELIEAELENWDNIKCRMNQIWEDTKYNMISRWSDKSTHVTHSKWIKNNMDNMLKKMQIEFNNYMESLYIMFLKQIELLKKNKESKERWNIWMRFMEWKENEKEKFGKWLKKRDELWEEWMDMLMESVDYNVHRGKR